MYSPPVGASAVTPPSTVYRSISSSAVSPSSLTLPSRAKPLSFCTMAFRGPRTGASWPAASAGTIMVTMLSSCFTSS